jgi:hypothetical protein
MADLPTCSQGLLGINGRMLCTDSLEDLAVHPALNDTQRISTQNIQVVCLSQLVTEFLDVNRCLCVTLRPQEMAHFPINRNDCLFYR